MRLSNTREMKETMPKKVNGVIFLSVALMSLWLALSSCQAQSGSWERIKQSGVLRVGLDPTYPPFEVSDGDGAVGLDIDLANALASELGLNSEFIYFGYDGLYDALAT